MMIRELILEERDVVSALLLMLSDKDRFWRFCRPMTDQAVLAYAHKLDWQDTIVFGAFDSQIRLVGIAELCDLGEAAEIAVTVRRSSRRRGVGAALMDLAMLKAKMLGKRKVALTCLSQNMPMRRLARRAGLTSADHPGPISGAPMLGALEEPLEGITPDLVGSVTYARFLSPSTC